MMTYDELKVKYDKLEKDQLLLVKVAGLKDIYKRMHHKDVLIRTINDLELKIKNEQDRLAKIYTDHAAMIDSKSGELETQEAVLSNKEKKLVEIQKAINADELRVDTKQTQIGFMLEKNEIILNNNNRILDTISTDREELSLFKNTVEKRVGVLLQDEKRATGVLCKLGGTISNLEEKVLVEEERLHGVYVKHSDEVAAKIKELRIEQGVSRGERLKLRTVQDGIAADKHTIEVERKRVDGRLNDAKHIELYNGIERSALDKRGMELATLSDELDLREDTVKNNELRSSTLLTKLNAILHILDEKLKEI